MPKAEMPAVELIESPWNEEGRVTAVVTSRSLPDGDSSGYAGLNLATHVGDSAARVEANRRRLAAALEVPLSWHWLNQVHGTEVFSIETAAAPRLPPSADASTTVLPRQVCGVLTADCLPVFFYSPLEARVAIAHAGWRGLAAGVLEKTLAAFSGSAQQVRVWLGPAIGPCHFEVGLEVREAFLAQARTAASKQRLDNAFVPGSEQGKYWADLYALARSRLADAGVCDVEGGDLCTFSDASRFYSYRREPECGRMLSLIFIN